MMLKYTINKLFFNKKKKKSSQQDCCSQNTEQQQQTGSSVESVGDVGPLNSELKSARRFIQDFRKRVLNLDNSYKAFYDNNCTTIINNKNNSKLNHDLDNRFAPFTNLKRNLKEPTMYSNEFRNENHYNLDNSLKSSLKLNQKAKLHQLSRYFDLKGNKKVRRLNDNYDQSTDNQQLIGKLRSLRLKYGQERLQPKEHYELNQRYDRRLNQLSESLESKLDNRYTNQLKSMKAIENRLRDSYLKQNFCNCKKNDQNLQNLGQNFLEPLQPFSQNYIASLQNLKKDASIKSREISFFDDSTNQYDTDSSLNSSNLSRVDNELFLEDDDDYLDVYTIGSADSIDNPISTDNFTQLITKLTYQDEMRSKLIDLCDQNDALDFHTEFSKEKFPNVLNLDSGTFAVTFLASDQNNNLLVLKMIRTISKDIQSRLTQLNYSGTETFDEVYNEIIISRCLSSLHDSKVNRAHCFPKILFAKLVRGSVPENFIINKEKLTSDKNTTLEEFEELINKVGQDHNTPSENLNDCKKVIKQEPFKMFPDAPKEYVIIAMKYVGKPIWKRLYHSQLSPVQLFSIAQQLIFGLACAEQQFNFEHRDLHISNVLVKRTKKAEVEFMLNDEVYRLPTEGYRCFIVDMTFSRLTVGDQVFFKDLNQILYKRKNVEGKKLKMQEIVYQLMRDEIGENWQKFRPRTNIHWLVYVLKTIKSEVIKKESTSIGKLFVDYYKHASQCSGASELAEYVIDQSCTN